MTRPGVPIVELGRVAFATAHARMLQTADAVLRGEPGEVMLLEHDPVYTAGRATPPAERIPGCVDVERGGRLTFHGPGQLVVYPIVRLPYRDVRRWLRALEQLGVDVCDGLGLAAEPSVDGTGVFVAGRKVASIGVAIRRWINLHGIAINVAVDLEPFRRIRPCGLDPSVMGDLSSCLGRPLSLASVVTLARAALPRLLAAEP